MKLIEVPVVWINELEGDTSYRNVLEDIGITNDLDEEIDALYVNIDDISTINQQSKGRTALRMCSGREFVLATSAKSLYEQINSIK